MSQISRRLLFCEIVISLSLLGNQILTLHNKNVGVLLSCEFTFGVWQSADNLKTNLKTSKAKWNPQTKTQTKKPTNIYLILKVNPGEGRERNWTSDDMSDLFSYCSIV